MLVVVSSGVDLRMGWVCWNQLRGCRPSMYRRCVRVTSFFVGVADGRSTRDELGIAFLFLSAVGCWLVAGFKLNRLFTAVVCCQ